MFDFPYSPRRAEEMYPLVLIAFNSSFPEATHVKWMEKDTRIIFYFFSDDKLCSALYTKDGCLLCFIKNNNKLSGTIRARVDAKFPGYQIEKVREFVSGSNRMYEIFISKGHDFRLIKLAV